MSESKYTPGPWTIEPYDKFDKQIFIVEPRAVVDNDDVDHEEAAANARLIRACPDLLEALQEIVKLAAEKAHGPISARARAAIAKATGA